MVVSAPRGPDHEGRHVQRSAAHHFTAPPRRIATSRLAAQLQPNDHRAAARGRAI